MGERERERGVALGSGARLACVARYSRGGLDWIGVKCGGGGAEAEAEAEGARTCGYVCVGCR